MPPAVTVHTLAHCRAALSAADKMEVTLLTAPNAVLYAGLGYLRAMMTRAAAEFSQAAAGFAADCGDYPGLVLAALRSGWRIVVFTGDSGPAAALADIALQQDALLWRDRPPSLDLLDRTDVEAACRHWFVTGEVLANR